MCVSYHTEELECTYFHTSRMYKTEKKIHLAVYMKASNMMFNETTIDDHWDVSPQIGVVILINIPQCPAA